MTKRLFPSTLIIFVGLSAGCSSLGVLPKPKVETVTPRITGIDFQGIDMDFDVGVSNPYPVPIKTPQFKYQIDIQDKELMKSDHTAKLDLPAGKTGTVKLPVRMGYADVLRIGQRLGSAQEIPYTLKGELIVAALGESFSLPVSHAGSVPVLRPPTFTSPTLNVTDRSLTKAGVAINAKMQNPNKFEINIKDVGYQLMVGDIEVGNLKATSADKIAGGGSAPVSLTGEVSGATALAQLLKGKGLGVPKIIPSGFIETPYGKAKLPK